MAKNENDNSNNESNNLPDLSGEDIARLRKETKLAEQQYNSLTEAIKAGKDALDQYIARAKVVTDQFVEAKIAVGGFYEGVSVANEKLKEEIDILEGVNSALEQDYRQKIQDSIEALAKLKEEKKSLGDLESQLADDQKERIELLQKEIDTDNKAIETLTKKIEIGKKFSTDTLQDEITLTKLKNDLVQKNTDLENANKVAKVQDMEATLKNSQAKAQDLAQLMSENNLRKLQADSIQNTSKAVAGLTDGMFGASTQTNAFTSAFIAMSDKSKTFSNIGGAISESFLKPENAMNRFFNFLNKNLIQSTFEFDKILAQVNRDTGGFREEFEQVGMRMGGSAAGALATYGVDLQKLGKAYADLSSKINGFNEMADSQRKMLTENAATMENLGVSMSTYAGITATLMGSIGKSAEGAKNTINTLAKEAIAAGRNVGEYVKEFEQLMPKLAAYGREATQIFKELNAFASMTKGVMSTGDLESFASQFDNWDSAAESVSKLNVALGGASVNIADLMKADPSEKLMMIKRAFDESGQDWDKLNAGYRKMLAESFGGDVAKAAAFFKGSLADANAQMQEAAATEAELEERKKKSVDAQERLTKAIESMKLSLTPVIDIVASIAEGIAGLNESFGPIGTFLAVGLPLGFLAFTQGFKLVGAIGKASMGEVTKTVKAELDQVIGKAKEAQLAVNSIDTNLPGRGPSGGGGLGPQAPSIDMPDIPEKPSGGADGSKSSFMSKYGGTMAIAGLSFLPGIYGMMNKPDTVASNPNYLVNQEQAPKTDDADFSSTRPIVTFDDSNRPVVLANTNNKDRFSTVRATTPESRAKEKTILQNSLVSEQNSNVRTDTNNTFLAQHIEKLHTQTEQRMEKQNQMYERITNYQPVININATAGLDPKAAEELNKRAVRDAVAKSHQESSMKMPSSLISLDSRTV